MYITVGIVVGIVTFWVALFIQNLNTDLRATEDMFFALFSSTCAGILAVLLWPVYVAVAVLWLMGRYLKKPIIALLHKVEDLIIK